MFEVFNMGCRLELYCHSTDAEIMIEAAQALGIDAQIIGRVEVADKKELQIEYGGDKKELQIEYGGEVVTY